MLLLKPNIKTLKTQAQTITRANRQTKEETNKTKNKNRNNTYVKNKY